jgi:FkbM family methyltransferase
MSVDGQSQVGRLIYALGHYEQSTVDVMRGLVTEGDTVVDGGAHIGFFTLLCSRLVGQTGAVHAFEPSHINRAGLERNVAINGMSNVVVHPLALGAEAGQCTLSYTASADTGLATTRPVQAVFAESVQVAPLDALSLTRVTLVKLDLEGGECRALRGMRRLLLEQRPAVIVEVTDQFLRAAGDSAVELYRFMRSCGYEALVIGDSGPESIESEEALARLPDQFNALFRAATATHA